MTQTMTDTPKVYVGTWRQYNNGSIAGAWIDLAGCTDYQDFLRKCKQAHKNESDPEYMIQDSECFPDGLCVRGEWLNEQDFNDVMQAYNEAQHTCYSIIEYSEKALAVVGDTRNIADRLKAIGGRFNPRLTCGAGWIFSKTKEAELRAILGGADIDTTPRDTKADEYKRTLEEHAQTLTEYRAEYVRKQYVGAVKVHGGVYLLPKYSIEVQFCWHDEGEQYEEYKHITSDEDRLKKYFLRENLDKCDRNLNMLTSEYEVVLTLSESFNEIRLKQIMGWNRIEENDIRMTQEDKQIIREALMWCRGLFEKRLNTYLKRYGTSKLHTWTYWADR